ncbi:MAG: MerR family transcriptional regulator [Mycobacterium sp.]|jgi:MerR family copper efflux transcriptional regulator|uniref:MerR family transcriptional regulator n=1 Tax=Mycobacterium sp. TaxID=1785 RepID=UPI00389A7162
MTEKGQRIGDAAAVLAVAPHVLRHWEDVGLLRPRRLSSGHRAYDDQTIGQARMIQICQRAGLSLTEIKELGVGDRGNRVALIESKRAQIAQQVWGLRLADKFLAHIAHCEHPVTSECPECSAITGKSRSRGR